MDCSFAPALIPDKPQPAASADTLAKRKAERKAELLKSLETVANTPKRPQGPLAPQRLRGTTYEHRGDAFVKAGHHVESAEVSALQLIQDRLEIPVPRLRHASTAPSGDITIEMDFIEGITLWEAWKDMSADQKTDIAQQLRAILVAVRSLTPESTHVGACDGGQVLDLRDYDVYKGGPFPDEDAFNDWLVQGIRPGTPSNMRREFRKRLRSGHRMVLTNGDFSQQNIIVRDNKVVGLVDWQTAGWLPEQWEFVKFFGRRASSSDWYEYADVIFPETYYDDFLSYHFLQRWQFGFF